MTQSELDAIRAAISAIDCNDPDAARRILADLLATRG